MLERIFPVCLLSLAFAAPLSHGAVLITNSAGVYGYKDTPKLPWCEWLVHDPDRPEPRRVNPGRAEAPVPAPSDAIVLFSGGDTDKWQPLKDWKVENGHLVSGNQALTTKEDFADVQLHVEWMGPENFEGPWSNRGNNGVMLMGLFEIQIFDSFNEKIYPDGQCAAIYGQTPPLVNVTRAPGQWESFDIIFTAPRFENGTLRSPARVTVFHNGVLVQKDEVIHGEISHRGLPAYNSKKSSGPLVLGGHGCPVRFRNIWLRKL